MEKYYTIPSDPQYSEQIRELRDEDPASATDTFNPLIGRMVENTAALARKMSGQGEMLETVRTMTETAQAEANQANQTAATAKQTAGEALELAKKNGDAANVVVSGETAKALGLGTLENLVLDGDFTERDMASLAYWVCSDNSRWDISYDYYSGLEIRTGPDFFYAAQSPSRIAGQAFYVRMLATCGDATASVDIDLGFCKSAFDRINRTGTVQSCTLTDQGVLVSAIIYPDADSDAMYIGVRGDGGYIYIKNVMMVDVTAAFDHGHEPTKEWCDQNIEYSATECTRPLSVDDALLEMNKAQNALEDRAKRAPHSVTFTSSGMFDPSTYGLQPGDKISIICIGAGGGGGYNGSANSSGGAGGGGAGAIVFCEHVLTSSNATTVTVGKGGTGATSSTGIAGTNGTSSSFGSIVTAVGGHAASGATAGAGGNMLAGTGGTGRVGNNHGGAGGAGGFVSREMYGGNGADATDLTSGQIGSAFGGNSGGCGKVSTSGSALVNASPGGKSGLGGAGGDGGSTSYGSDGADGGIGEIPGGKGGKGGDYTSSGSYGGGGGGGGTGYGAGGGGGGSRGYLRGGAGGDGADGVVIISW